jgi:hypothetical protein
VCRLEDIAARRPDLLPQPGPGQGGFDFDQVPGPASPVPSTSPLHLEVGR